jgi:LPXTG-site transpeptidase (sortase) family protein
VTQVPAACKVLRTTKDAEPTLPAILAVPALGLEAPVLQGLSDPVLSKAVGHDSTSVWPGSKGISVLLAHDVSYFSSLGSVRVNDKVYWIDGCRSLMFKVDRIEVAQPGASLPPPLGGIGVALITCWPTDALFWTPDRLVVLASFVSMQTTRPRTIAKSPPLDVAIAVPTGLASAGLGLSQNGIRVGHLRLVGKPDRSWAEGADPLRTAGVALEELAVVSRTLDTHNKKWWSDIALPGAAMPYSISLAENFDITVTVNGTHVSAVTLASSSAKVDLVARSGKLYVSSAGL